MVATDESITQTVSAVTPISHTFNHDCGFPALFALGRDATTFRPPFFLLVGVGEGNQIMEPSNHVIIMHARYAPKPSAQLAKTPTPYFVGKYVKVRFPCPRCTRCGGAHMGVLGTPIETAGIPLVGRLQNEPPYADYLQNGATVRVLRTQLNRIEAVALQQASDGEVR